jgi:integrase
MSEKIQKINGLPEFSGPFKELIVEYISFKRAQGYKLLPPFIYRLREMDLFFLKMGIQEVKITREMYEAWTAQKQSEKARNAQIRQGAIRGFAAYLVQLGYQNVYTGYDDTRIFKSDFIPYVFSRNEIDRMFQVLSKICKDSPGYDNDTFRMAMLLYYSCGFRKSEVLNLKIQDIDFQNGKITILHGKNDVSRIVVASSSLLAEILVYYEKYLEDSSVDEYFIHGPKSHRYTDTMLYEKFHWLLTEAAIPLKPDGGCQRLHDVRHTFCVRALEQMQAKGFDLYTSLPLLSRYLGHKHITETEYYLRLLEEHFGGILQKSDSCYPKIFPKMIGGDAGE